MSSIITVTLNSAIDKSRTVTELRIDVNEVEAAARKIIHE